MKNIGPEIAVWLSVGVKRPTRLSGRRHVYLHRLHMTHTREYSLILYVIYITLGFSYFENRKFGI